MSQYDAILNIGGVFDERAFESKLQQSMSRMEKGMKFAPFSGTSRSVRDFSSELDRANQRVITLGASFAVLSTAVRVFKDIATATVVIEKSLLDVNAVLQLSSTNLDKFSQDLFDVARNTSQSFEKAAEAAKEFSRQGLGAEETLKRTRDAMILTRLASVSTEEAVQTLTAAVNGFQKSGLDTTQIVNKLATVDAKFAVSAKDLAQGLSRAGSVAQDAGVSFDKLIGIITSAQQTTARGGAVIGNAIKTIFTRIERKDTLETLQGLGVAITDAAGDALSAEKILLNFANVYDKLGNSVKKGAAELVAGGYQINILKAIMSDLQAGTESVSERASKTSEKAANEAIKRNEALNKSLDAVLQRASTTYQQVGAKIGQIGFSGAAKNVLGALAENPITNWISSAGDSDTNSMGEKAAAGFVKGFGDAIIFGLGPSVILAIARITQATVKNISKDFAEVSKGIGISREQRTIQSQIVSLYDAGDAALKRQLTTMGSLAERASLVESILARGAARQAFVASEISSLAGAVVGARKTPRAAGGYNPFSAEASAIRAGVGGASAGAKPVMIPNFAFGGGVTGPIVANTSEWMVKKSGGSSIYNPAMIQKMGLPPGATPIAAGGYIPNMAVGGNPYGLPPEWGSADYYKNTGAGSAKAPSYPFGIPPGAPYVSSSPVTGSASGQGIGQFITSIEHLGTQLPASLKKALDTFNVNLQTMALGKVTPYGPNVPPTFLANQALGGTSVPLSHGPAAPTEKQLAKMEKDKSEFLKKAFEKSKAEDDLRSADFAKSQKELNKQHALDVKASELKQKQLDEMAEQLDNKKKITSFSDSELRQQERVNDMLRKAESINMEYAKEALLPIVHKVQAKAAVEAIPKAQNFYQTPEAQSMSSVRESMNYMDKQARSIRMSAVREPTFIEKGIGKNLYGLSNIQLEKLGDITGGMTGMKRGERVQALRGELGAKATDTDRINTMVGLARSGTLSTNFSEQTKWAIGKGDTLESAMNYASKMFMESGGTMKQLARAQVKLVGGLVEYEKNVIEAAAAAKQQAIEERRMGQLTRKSSQGEITRQTILNAANERLATGDKFTSLSQQQQSAYKNQLKAQAAQSLGFGGDIAGAMMNPTARAQISGVVSKQIGELMAGTGLGAAGGKKESWFSKNPLAAQLGLSMGLPMIGGAIPSAFSEGQRKGGTVTGMGIGAVSGAFTGAGTGAAIGSFLPGIGTGAGAIAGAAAGGLFGLFGKLETSFEELAETINRVNEKIRKEDDAIVEARRAFSELSSMKQEGGSPRDVEISNKKFKSALARIQDPAMRSAIVGGDEEYRQAVSQRSMKTDKELLLGSLMQATKGASKASGIFGMSDQETKTGISSISEAFAEFFKDKTLDEIQKYKEAVNKNPDIIRKILADAGATEAQIQEAVPKTPSKTSSYMMPGGMGFGGRDEFGEMVQKGLSVGLVQAEEAVRLVSLSGEKMKAEAVKLIDVRGRSEKYRRGADLSRAISGADRSIFDTSQDIEMSKSERTDYERIGMKGRAETQRVEMGLAANQVTLMEELKRILIDTVGKEGSESIKKDIDQLSSPEQINKFMRVLSDPKLSVEKGYGTLKTKDLIDALSKAGTSIDGLKIEADQQIRAINANTSAQEKGYRENVAAAMNLKDISSKYMINASKMEALGERESKVAGARQQITQSRIFGPEKDKFLQQSAFDVSRISIEAEKTRAQTITRGKAGMIEALGSGGNTVAMRSLIENLTPEKIDQLASLPNQISGLTPELQTSVKNLSNTLKLLKISEENNIKTAQELNDLFLNDLEYKDSVAGRVERILGTAKEQRRDSVKEAMATLEADKDPSGSKLISGSQKEAAMMTIAKDKGLGGDSLGSLKDGFLSGFARMKKEMGDLSELGANLGRSLSSNLSGAFGDFVTGAKSGKDAFRSFAVSVLGDASRMFASQAIQGILGSVFGGISPAIGRANGGPIPFAAGGKVPAMLTGGEYYIGPKAAKSIGYDTLHRLNKYADGGIVRGGSGVKDDVPARLAPGSFIIKKSAVGKLGPDYLDSLVNGKVQHRFFGGLLMGAVMGGALGYATGGKKGALIGAIGGGIAGGLAQNFAQTGHLLKAEAGASMFQFSPSAAASGPTLQVGTSGTGMDSSAVRNLDPAKLNVNDLVTKAPMPIWQKAAIGLGASALLGGVSSMLAPKDPKFTPMNATEISANRVKLEAEQRGMTPPSGLFPWLSANPNGGFNQMGYVLPPTRRMYANGGMVNFESPGLFEDGGEVKIQSPRLFVNSGKVAPQSSRLFEDNEAVDKRPSLPPVDGGKANFQSPRVFADAGKTGLQSPRILTNSGKPAFQSPLAFVTKETVDPRPFVTFANSEKADFQSPRLFANGGMVDSQPSVAFEDGGKVDFKSPALFMDGGKVGFQPSVPFANGGKVDFQSPRLFANGGTVDFQSPRILTNDGKADFKPTRVFADGGKVDFESPRLFANGGMVNIQPPRLFANGGPVDFQSPRLFADTGTTSSRPSRLFANGGEVDFESPRLFADGGMVGGGSVEMATPMTAPSGGGGSSNVSVKIEINNNGTSSATASSDKKDGQGGFGPDFAMKLQKQVQGIVQQELVNQSRSDGFFAQKSRFVQGR